MSEQRFTYGNPIGFGKGEIIDNQTNIHYEATINVLLQLLNDFDDVLNEQQATIHELRNENIISKNKIEDLRVSLFMADKELQRQMQKRDLDE